jgi:Spy/CpxP family protein refolding chaperone
MTRFFLWLGLLIAVGLAAYGMTRWMRNPAPMTATTPALQAMPGLSWLKRELKLTEAQAEKISALHQSYLPRCAELCESIERSHEKVDRLAQASASFTEEYRAAMREHAEVHLQCQTAMIEHLYEVAGTLEPSQSRRYLDLMLPYALDASHRTGHAHCPLCQSEK